MSSGSRPGRVHSVLASRSRTWLKVRAPGSENYLRLKGVMKELKLHTVCEEARCPNIGECWHHGTATFMILGDVCTRACAYCAVAHGKPHELDRAEPARVADAIERMALQLRGHHLGRSRRPRRRRRVHLRGDHPRDPRARPRLPHRGADSRLPGLESSLRAVLDAAPTCSITTSRRCRGSIAWRDRAEVHAVAGAARSIAALSAGDRHEDGHHGRPRRGIDEVVGRLRRPAPRRVSRSSRSDSTCARLRACADGPLLSPRRVRRAEAPGARARLRARRIRSTCAKLVSRR